MSPEIIEAPEVQRVILCQYQLCTFLQVQSFAIGGQQQDAIVGMLGVVGYLDMQDAVGKH